MEQQTEKRKSRMPLSPPPSKTSFRGLSIGHQMHFYHVKHTRFPRNNFIQQFVAYSISYARGSYKHTEAVTDGTVYLRDSRNEL